MSNSNEKKPGILGRFLSQRGMGQVITVGVGLVILCLVFQISLHTEMWQIC